MKWISSSYIISATIKNSDLWYHIQIRDLRRNMRVEKMTREDPEQSDELNEFVNQLLELRKGTLTPIVQNIIQIPDYMVCQLLSQVQNIVYDNFQENFSNIEYLSKRVIMSYKNETVQYENYRMVNKLLGELFVAYSINKCFEDKDKLKYELEVLNKIEALGFPPYHLALKKMQLLFFFEIQILKMDIEIVQDILQRTLQNMLLKKKLNGDGGPNNTNLIPRIIIFSKESDFPEIFKRKQFIVVRTYYLTFNRV